MLLTKEELNMTNQANQCACVCPKCSQKSFKIPTAARLMEIGRGFLQLPGAQRVAEVIRDAVAAAKMPSGEWRRMR